MPSLSSIRRRISGAFTSKTRRSESKASSHPGLSPVMALTFSAAPHNANPVYLEHLPAGGYTPAEILAQACPKQHSAAKTILQYGFSGVSDGTGEGRDFAARFPNLVPDRNGFVNTVIAAYNQHHALVIRPDDVWLAILCQFNFFVNANAELLRASFVAHEGQRELVIEEEGTRNTVDFGDMSRQMAGLLEKNVVDPTLREWAIPNFTTTTEHDKTVGAVLMMATLKQYFTYVFDCTCCGIPRITLEGEKADWANILERLEKLKEYGIETTAWYHLLHPIISRFVAAFDDPNSAANADFWNKVVHFESLGSGPDYYTGWINAFGVFSEQGNWLGYELKKEPVDGKAPDSLSAEEFWPTYVDPARWKYAQGNLIAGAPYHRLDTSCVPVGYTAVDVKLIDNGKPFDAAMVAGMIGMQVSSSGDPSLSSTGMNDVVRPVSGWCMYIKN
ncbi:hypothetical protein MSAN_02212800 [Mycena sanguinolenta]|uniref:DUF4419 domain-containing protein n=1 Tax=Mycena sanguinolenta TaxID=230812 RepID=A0A8H6XE74_9AGAR|nr:hypothetical protein MSAN_02212800 [Mycena sanguinolenta]